MVLPAVPEPTVQSVMVALLDADGYLNNPPPNGLGFTNAYGKWLVDGEGPGAEPDAFNTAGRIKPNIVVLMDQPEVNHPSAHVPGHSKWDVFPSVYLFHYPSEQGKAWLAQGALRVEYLLTRPEFQPVVSGGQRPVWQWDNTTDIDNGEQFPGNYVKIVRFRVTGMRIVQG
jgi:hypothetical protein